jgi:pSer/pThr/pTyr-binding forkhead associated (FHA) protein
MRLVLRPGGPAVDLTRPDMLVGRHSDADVRLSLPDISRRHCRFVFTANRWQVFDLNSLNGVFVNGHQVQQATVDQGDVIRIGGLTFEVELVRPAPPVEPDPPRESPARPNILRSITDALPEPDSWPPRRKAS